LGKSFLSVAATFAARRFLSFKRFEDMLQLYQLSVAFGADLE
jgi:hypothetical protein